MAPSAPADPSVVRYRVDVYDRIIEVDPGFVAFATANGAPDLPGACLGRSLYAFMEGADVMAFHRDLLRRIRAIGSVDDVPFRCDAPDERRFMRLSATAHADGSIAFVCRLERTEATPRLPQAASAEGAGRSLVQCAWCGRIDADGWMEIEEAVRRLHLLEDLRAVVLAPGICPDCLRLATSPDLPGAGRKG